MRQNYYGSFPRKVVRNLKQTLQKLSWSSLAPLLLAVVMTIVPVMAVAVIPEMAGAQGTPPGVPQCPDGYTCNPNASVASLFEQILSWALAIAFMLAVVFLIYGGYQYIFAGGNEEKARAGRMTIFNSLIGVVIIVLSYIIVQIVYRFVSGQGSSAFGS